MDPKSHTQDPIVTGSSVLGIKFDGGVMLMADTLACYGSMPRFKNVRRISKITNSCIISASGEFSDFQQIEKLLHDEIDEDFCEDDKITLTAKEIFELLTRIMYNKRTQMNPLFNTVCVAGVDIVGNQPVPFLGYIDLVGTFHVGTVVAAGYGKYFGVPLMRTFAEKKEEKGEKITEDEAREQIMNAMKVLLYRDCKTINRFQIATVKADGVTISDPFKLETTWYPIPQMEQQQ